MVVCSEIDIHTIVSSF